MKTFPLIFLLGYYLIFVMALAAPLAGYSFDSYAIYSQTFLFSSRYFASGLVALLGGFLIFLQYPRHGLLILVSALLFILGIIFIAFRGFSFLFVLPVGTLCVSYGLAWLIIYVNSHFDFRTRLLSFVPVFFLPFFLSLSSNPQFIFNLYYGRPRLLLGYVHPKEAAASLLFLFAVFFIDYLRLLHTKMSHRRPSFFTFTRFLPLFLSFLSILIGSRSAAIIFLMIFLSTFFRFNQNFALSLFAVASAFLAILSVILSNKLFFNAFDHILSNRLSFWLETTSDPLDAPTSFSRLGSSVDNSLLGIYLDGGYLALSLLFMALFLVFFVSLRSHSRHLISTGSRFRPNIPLLILTLLSTSVFDSGLLSPTSFLFVSLWTIIILSLRAINCPGLYSIVAAYQRPL